MGRQRVNPFDLGTAERVLYDRYRAAAKVATQCLNAASRYQIDASAHRDAANRYAEALRALGHGDKVPGQAQLPAPTA